MPFFLYALTSQVPQQYEDMYPDTMSKGRRQYSGDCDMRFYEFHFWDQFLYVVILGNLFNGPVKARKIK